MTLIQVVAAALLLLGSVLVLRAVWAADHLEPTPARPATPAPPSEGVDLRRAA